MQCTVTDNNGRAGWLVVEKKKPRALLNSPVFVPVVSLPTTPSSLNPLTPSPRYICLPNTPASRCSYCKTIRVQAVAPMITAEGSISFVMITGLQKNNQVNTLIMFEKKTDSSRMNEPSQLQEKDFFSLRCPRHEPHIRQRG